MPILKWKRGEQNALETLDAPIKESLTPLIEIAPIDWDYELDQPKKTIDEHLRGIIDTFTRSWNSERPFFLDMLWIDPAERMEDGEHPLTYILQNARENGINIVPVTDLRRDEAYQQEVRKALDEGKLGLCFRLTDDDFEDLQTNIEHLLSIFEVSPPEIDLLIDYKYTNPSEKNKTYLFLTGLLNNIPYCLEWRNIILAGTSMPADLSEIDSNTIGEIERSEWIIWNRLLNNINKFERLPIFGDYVIANPEPFDADPRMIRMSANIRYTSGDRFIIFKGLQVRRYGSNQYHLLADQLVQHPEYRGPSFSAGDRYIYDVANNENGPGNATKWREAGTSHHLTLVVNDLASLFYSSISF